MISAIAGFLAGTLHVFAGPDHLAAIAPLAVDGRSRAWKTGLRWGLGHAAGVIVVGFLSLMLRDLLPLKNISDWSERLVGVLLIAIGLWGIRKAMQVHSHEHEHAGERHVHLHIHSASQPHQDLSAHTHGHTAFGIGTIHGLAGSSHFFGVLPTLAFPRATEGIIYLVAFGLGTIAAMLFFSTAISKIAGRMTKRNVKGYRNAMCCCSFATLLIGGYWLFV
ncbi:MAG: sulfite exporter TauE/SafE family protein [Verrucomicrobiota bacterium]